MAMISVEKLLRTIVRTLGVFLFIVTAFAPQETLADDKKILYIVTTTAQVADIVRNVAGPGTAIVESLMGEGTDPHLYRPTSSDIRKLHSADIVFYNGLHLEGQMVELLETLAEEKPVFPVARALETNALLDGPDGASLKHDPHIWMDVGNWIRATTFVADRLSSEKRGRQTMFQRNARAYERKLKKLDEYARDTFQTIPKDARVLVTAHDAFGYLGKAYDIEVIGIQGISTESEAGLKRIEEIVDLLVNRKIPAVFIESSVSDRNVQALIEGAAARDHAVSIGGTLYSDAMGASGSYEGTYIGMIDHNVTLITHALGGEAPEKGMQKKLTALRAE